MYKRLYNWLDNIDKGKRCAVAILSGFLLSQAIVFLLQYIEHIRK